MSYTRTTTGAKVNVRIRRDLVRTPSPCRNISVNEYVSGRSPLLAAITPARTGIVRSVALVILAGILLALSI